MIPHHWNRITGAGGVIAALVGVVLLAACGGTSVPPTANDAATVAAARTATAGIVPTAGGAMMAAVGSGGRGFGSLLTPAATGRMGQATARGTVASVGSTPAPRGTGTPVLGNSPQSAPLDPCTFLTPAELTRTMGEPFSQADSENEAPADTMTRLRGYSSAVCAFAANGSMQGNLRAVQIGTIRRTPGAPAPTGTGAFRAITDVWTYIKQQAQQGGTNVDTLNGVGDDAVALDDVESPGEVNVFVRKGDVVLLIVVSGYGNDARDKAIAVARQVVLKL